MYAKIIINIIEFVNTFIENSEILVRKFNILLNILNIGYEKLGLHCMRSSLPFRNQTLYDLNEYSF